MIELFSTPISVLGTLAASYLCVAVIVKYYLMDNHTVIITPEHSQGSVTLFLIDTCVFTICYLFYPVALCALLMCVYVVCVCVCCVCVCVCVLCVFFSVGSWASMFSVVPTICFGFQVGSDFVIFTLEVV